MTFTKLTKSTRNRQRFFLGLWIAGACVYTFLAPSPWVDFMSWVRCTLSLGLATIAAAPLISINIANSKLGRACKTTMHHTQIAIMTLDQALHHRKAEFEFIENAVHEHNQINDLLPIKASHPQNNRRL